MKKELAFSIFMIFILKTYAQEIEIPSGVNYSKASEATNIQAKKNILKYIESKNEYLQIDVSVIIGPHLWRKYITSNYYKDQKSGIDLNFKIPNDKGVLTRKGRVFKQPKEFEPVWDFVRSHFSSKITIRLF